MANTAASPWGDVWPLLSLLCTIGSFACVAVPLRALTRRVARARWVVPAASLPCFARWVVRFRLECFPVLWACKTDPHAPLQTRTLQTRT